MSLVRRKELKCVSADNPITSTTSLIHESLYRHPRINMKYFSGTKVVFCKRKPCSLPYNITFLTSGRRLMSTDSAVEIERKYFLPVGVCTSANFPDIYCKCNYNPAKGKWACYPVSLNSLLLREGRVCDKGHTEILSPQNNLLL